MYIVACKLRAVTVPGVDDTFVNKSIWIHAEMAGELSPASIYGSQTYNSFGHNHFQKFGAVYWELDCEESWAPKNWCFWTVVLEKTLESPLDCKEIQPVQLCLWHNILELKKILSYSGPAFILYKDNGKCSTA